MTGKNTKKIENNTHVVNIILRPKKKKDSNNRKNTSDRWWLSTVGKRETSRDYRDGRVATAIEDISPRGW